jgi:hypothetical protein
LKTYQSADGLTSAGFGLDLGGWAVGGMPFEPNWFQGDLPIDIKLAGP